MFLQVQNRVKYEENKHMDVEIRRRYRWGVMAAYFRWLGFRLCSFFIADGIERLRDRDPVF